jgi:hypothetical protein
MSEEFARRKADFCRQLVAAAAVHGGTVKERTEGANLFAAEWHVKFPGIRYINVYLDDEGNGFSLHAVRPQRVGKTILNNVPLNKPEQIAAFLKGVAEGQLK